MNGGHDLGGMDGLGPINPEPEAEEPWFHHDWERHAFAITLASGGLGQWNIDESRFARERQHPAKYISNTYYENWLEGLVTLLLEKGLITEEELESGKAARKIDDSDGLNVLTADRVGPAMSKGGPVDMEASAPPRYKVGDKVRVVNHHPGGHTRAPRYTRGRLGTIAIHHGCHVFADRSADGIREGQHIYSVEFEADEVWGEGNSSVSTIRADLWEPHLEPAA